MNRTLLIFLVTLTFIFSANAQQQTDSAKAISNLVPTVIKLRELAKSNNPAAAAKEILLPGAESFDGVKTTYETKGSKRIAKHTWATTINGGEGKFNELLSLNKAAHAEMNRAFPGTYRQYPKFEWLLDSSFSIQIKLDQRNRDVVIMYADMYVEVEQNLQQLADSFRRIFYNGLSNANGNADQQAIAMRAFYWNLKNAGLSAEIINQAYFTVAKEKAANDPELAYLLLATYPNLIPAGHIWKALTPQTAAAVEQKTKASNAATLAASNKWYDDREAAEKKAAQKKADDAAALANSKIVKVIPGKIYTMKKIVVYKSQPSKNYVEATNGAIITGMRIYQKDILPGDNVFVENTLKPVSQVFNDYVLFNDNSSVRRNEWTVTVIRGVGLKSNVNLLNCNVCNNRPTTTSEIPINVVTGYKTHTYNTSGQTYNVVSSATKTKVGSSTKTTYCQACDGRAGTYVNQTTLELWD